MKVFLRLMIIFMHSACMLSAAQLAYPIVKRPSSAPPGFVIDSCTCTRCTSPSTDQNSLPDAAPPTPEKSAFNPRHVPAISSTSPITATAAKPLLSSLPSVAEKRKGGELSRDQLRDLQAYFAAKDVVTIAEQKQQASSIASGEHKEKERQNGDSKKKRGQIKKAQQLQVVKEMLVEKLANSSHESRSPS